MFRDKTVLITGAGNGIGAATARRLARDGARLLLLDRDQEAVARIATETSAEAHICDVSDATSMQAALEWCSDRAERLDAAVLNAGTEGRIGKIGELDIADFDRVMAVNVRSIFLGLSLLIPMMSSAGGGSIVALSSTAGVRGSRGLAPYVASKHAVIGLVRTAALEAAEAGVRINAVAPGPIETRMMLAIDAARSHRSPDKYRSSGDRQPMRRMGQPEEVAELIAFLCSDAASLCSGGVYMADGAGTAG